MQINSNNSLMPIKFSQTQKKDNFMMTMEKKESKMVEHLEEEVSEDFLISFQDEVKNKVDLVKVNQN